ncbi:hypothetical protein O4J56_04120 [Nocardiopsis sp. RSe5-2]|uniref:Uncharacterized protein n=1 Tax=Nocardiopsis endophytica TaxID=3018445 RepID=A0ABT4TYN3_9ACTN|nr:hypothetical protein [Nocardiopsis endophytica]MDA2809816.1 hypothetical protein [Nocardiopsis endophytica]
MSTRRDPVLALLRRYYGDRWSIRRAGSLWVAVANDPEADHAPTVVQPDIDAFLADLEDPPRRAGSARSLLSAEYFSQRCTEVEDGVWYLKGRPED